MLWYASFSYYIGYFSGSCRLWSTIFLLFLAMGLTAYIAYRLYTYQSLLDHIVSALEASSSYSNHDDYQISQRVISQSLSVSFSNVESTIAKVFNYLFAHAVRDCNGMIYKIYLLFVYIYFFIKLSFAFLVCTFSGF